MQALVVQLSTGIIVNVNEDMRIVFLSDFQPDKENKEDILEYAVHNGLSIQKVLTQWGDSVTQLAQHKKEKTQPETHQQRLGFFLQRSKKALGFSRYDVADAVGISYAYYGHLETGRRPIPVRVWAKLDKKFNLPKGTIEKLVRCAQKSDALQEDLLSDLLLDVTQLIINQSNEWAAMEYRHHVIPILKVP